VTVLHSPHSKADVRNLFGEKPSGSEPLTPGNKSNPLSFKRMVKIFAGRSALLNAVKSNWEERRMISLTNSIELGLLKWFMKMVVPLSLIKPIKDVSGSMVICYRFLFYLVDLRKKHGSLYVVNYLKLSQLAISRAVSRQPLSSLQELDPTRLYKRLTRNGLPIFIPSRSRRAILSGSTRVIRFWLTLYSVYRVLEAPATPKLSTITAPSLADTSFLWHLMEYFTLNARGLLKAYFKPSPDSLVVKKWINSVTASPITKVSWEGLYSTIYILEQNFPMILDAITEWIRITQEHPSSIVRTLLASYDTLKGLLTKEGIFPQALYEKCRTEVSLGFLSCKIEPAGKVRVFAMVDILTQNIMKPLHDVISKILKSLPNDGTFDQEGMVTRSAIKAARYQGAYCYDLSAATDTLPVLLQQAIISSLFGSQIASLWKFILVGRPYRLPDNEVNQKIFKDQPEHLGKDFYYSTGQPMGALSSFNMLGLTHHLIVQYCATMICKGNLPLYRHLYSEGWCIAYEILGDDIAIFHDGLAKKYLEVMSLIGVPINEKKSVVDIRGKTLELAKRTIFNGTDVSAISIKDIMTSAPFSQRTAIADRLIRRKIMSVSSATSILTRFIGENPIIRRTMMNISLFFGQYTSGRISFYDILFFLFLIKKTSTQSVGQQYAIQEDLSSLLESVLNGIVSNNLTSKSTSNGTVFPAWLYNKHYVEFNLSLYKLIYHYLDKLSEKFSDNLIEMVDKLREDYFYSLLMPVVDRTAEADKNRFKRIWLRMGKHYPIFNQIILRSEIVDFVQDSDWSWMDGLSSTNLISATPFDPGIDQDVWDRLIHREDYDSYYNPSSEEASYEVFELRGVFETSQKLESYITDLKLVTGVDTRVNKIYDPLTKYKSLFSSYNEIIISEKEFVPDLRLSVKDSQQILDICFLAYNWTKIISILPLQGALDRRLTSVNLT